MSPASNDGGSRSDSQPDGNDENQSLLKKRVLEEDECYDKLGYSFSTRRKWSILSVVFLVQLSMNFNASVYANAVPLLAEDFAISEQKARLGQAAFLLAYGIGSELWAPWSEELGRFGILQGSMALVNIWQILAACAPNFSTIVVARVLGGLSSAGGSVTLGMVADLYQPEDHGFAINSIVLASVAGSVVGPVFGAFIQTRFSWKANFISQLILGLIVQILHFFFVPETSTTLLVDREAKARREKGEKIWGPSEVKQNRFSFKEISTVLGRPFVMFATEPIVLCLSLLSGFSDSLIFTFLEAFNPVWSQWGFTTEQIGLAFLPLLIGYVLGFTTFIPSILKNEKIAHKNPDQLTPESRLYWLLFTAPLLWIGLIGFAWTSLGPPTPWIAPMLFSILIAIANFAIYAATIDCMVAAYGPYAASATGGNALARDSLAGMAALYSQPLYQAFPGRFKLQWPTTILAILAFLLTIPIYIFYHYGPQIRERSKFASGLDEGKKSKAEKKKNSNSQGEENA